MLRQIYQILSDFFFTPISYNVICIYRIIIGIATFAWGLLLAPPFLVWFGQHGLLPIETVKKLGLDSHFAINLITWFNPNDQMLWAMLFLYLAATICIAIGYCTRFSTLLAWVLMLSFCNRNPYILNGGDALLKLDLFLLIFAPAGQMYSVDSWLKKRFNPSKEVSILYEPWVQRLLQLQLAILYWESFWGKINGNDWWNGTAVYYATHMVEFHFLPVPWLFDQLWICKLLSWGTLIFEMSMWSLIWFKPFRYWLLVAGIFFHMGLNWSLNIPMFQFVVLSNYILFVGDADLQKVFAWLKKRLFILERPSWLLKLHI